MSPDAALPLIAHAPDPRALEGLQLNVQAPRVTLHAYGSALTILFKRLQIFKC